MLLDRKRRRRPSPLGDVDFLLWGGGGGGGRVEPVPTRTSRPPGVTGPVGTGNSPPPGPTGPIGVPPAPSSPPPRSPRSPAPLSPFAPLPTLVSSDPTVDALLGGYLSGPNMPQVVTPALEKKTLGEPSLEELLEGGLKLNDAGKITTPRTRRVMRRLRGPLPGLDPAQSRVASTVLGTGLNMDRNYRELLAATETGLVEAPDFNNPAYGDADSEGWRQERTSIYGTGPTGPRNVRASAQRFFDEIRTDPGTSSAATPGLLAQATQGSAYPERYDEEEGRARPILDEYLDRADAARRLGLPMPSAGQVRSALVKEKGPFAGSRRVVSSLIGQPVWGDKEPGHASGGMHDPTNPDAYAQDIGSAGANPAEGEPAYGQDTVSRIVQNLRRRGAEIPKGFELGENWEGGVDGYDIEFLTAPHGTGPHIHLGAEWTGERPPPGTYLGGGGAYGDQASALVAAGAPASVVGQAIGAANQPPAIPLSTIAPPITTDVPLPEAFQEAPSSGALGADENEGEQLLNLLSAVYSTGSGASILPRRRRRRT